MKTATKNILYIVLGVIVSITAFGLLTSAPLFFFMLHLGYFPIIEISDILWVFLYCAVISAIFVGIFFLIKKKNINLAKGFLASLAFVVVILFYNSWELVDYLTPQPFEKEIWDSDESKPLDMVQYILKKNTLEGMSKEQAIELLGKDFKGEYTDELKITYHIKGSRITFFQVVFDDEKKVQDFYTIYYD